MKKLLTFFVTFMLLTSSAWGRDLNDPSILRGYWRLNSNTNDYSGFENDGTWYGSEGYASAPWGQTVGDFDGSTDYVAIPDNDRYSFGDGTNDSPFSVGGWIEVVPGANIQIIMAKDKRGDLNETEWLIDLDADEKFEMYIVDPEDFPSKKTDNVLDSGWRHVMATYDGTGGATAADGITLYVDGRVVAQTATNDVAYSAMSNTDTIVRIGTASDVATSGGTLGLQFQGDIGEMRIYNVVLTADEVWELYTQNLPDYSPPNQPIDTIPDVSDSTLKGAWLNKAVVGGKDLSSNNEDCSTITDIVWDDVGGIFNGSSSKAITGSFSIGAAATISVWVNVTNTGAYDRILDTPYTTRYFLGLGSAGTTYSFITKNDFGCDAGTVETGTWQYVVGTYDGTNQRLYVDGDLVDTDAASAPTPAAAVGWIGYDGNVGAYFDGKLKDLRIYSEAKSADWIKAEYEKSVPDDNLKLHLVNGVDKSRYVASVTNTDTILNRRMRFNGTSSDLTVGAAGDYDFTSENFTIVTWLKTDIQPAETADVIFWQGSYEVSGYYLYLTTNSQPHPAIIINQSGGTDIIESSQGIIVGKMTHIAFVRNSTTGSFYINGTEVSGYATQDTIANPASASANTAILGSYDAGGISNWFDGEIQDFRIYSGDAKSADWIKADYERTKKFY